ncbi:MAG: NADPH-dependent FMN reductase [Candidatus Thermoplasmatota archaeon]
MSLNIPVILGTERDGRQSEHLARFVVARLQARTGMHAVLIDPGLHHFGNLRTRAMDVEQAPNPEVRSFIEQMHAADGFVIVTPEYNFSFPGALKNLLDVTFKPWNKKPFGLVGCGGISGGMRAIDSLRQVVSGLGAVCVPAHVPVQFIGKTFGPDGPLVEAEAWTKRVDSFLDEVLWYAEALKAARAGPVQA